MTYFFDNNFSPKIAKILSICEDVDAIHLQEEFPPHVPDAVWLSEAGRRGWVVLTGDARIRTRPVEREALESADVTAVIVHKGFMRYQLRQQAIWIIRHWPNIAKAVSRVCPGASLRVDARGRVTRLT
ncbi:MAG: hypothetical protein ACE5JM_09065 [Armatimonadota bacterium]